MAVKVTSVSLPQETIEKVNELSRSIVGSFSAKIDAVIGEAYDLAFWAGVDLGEVFTEEELTEMKDRCILLSDTAKFSNELFLKICPEEMRDKVQSLTHVQCWALWRILSKK